MIQDKGCSRAERNTSPTLCFKTVNNYYFGPNNDFPEIWTMFSDAKQIVLKTERYNTFILEAKN